MDGIFRAIKDLETEIERLEGLKKNFPESSNSTFVFHGDVSNCVIGRVVDGSNVFNSIEDIDAKIEKKKEAIRALNNCLN